MYAGSLAKGTVSIGDRTMVVDQYNPRDARHFQHAGQVAIEIPRTVHPLKKREPRARPDRLEARRRRAVGRHPRVGRDGGGEA
jgi:hypothetical protein